jgi:hypothetical protein
MPSKPSEPTTESWSYRSSKAWRARGGKRRRCYHFTDYPFFREGACAEQERAQSRRPHPAYTARHPVGAKALVRTEVAVRRRPCCLAVSWHWAFIFIFKASGSERPADLERAVTGTPGAHRWRAVIASTSSPIWCVAHHVVCPLGFGLPPQPERDDHRESFTRQPEPQRALQKMMNAAAAGYKALVITSGRNYDHKQESYKLRTTYYTHDTRSLPVACCCH